MNEVKQEKQKIRLIKSGKDFFDTLAELITCANSSIYLNFYIFSDDYTGNQILQLLSNAVNKGVHVFLLTDGFATTTNNSFSNKIKIAGIHYKRHAPIFKQHEYLARRMHEKLALIDESYLLIGGMNVSDKYNLTDTNEPWLDFAVLLKGSVANSAYAHCMELWKSNKQAKTHLTSPKTCFSIDQKLTMSCRANLLINDWLLHRNEITNKYIQLIRSAKTSITILCSYFIPGAVIRRLLATASAKGVKIKIVTAGISDVYLAKAAEKWLYDWLLRNKIEIYEYQRNVLHGKLAIADQHNMTIGSYNVNNISAYTSMELNVEINDTDFCKESEAQIKAIMNNDCIQITQEKHLQQKNWVIQFTRWLSYQFIRITIALFTLNYKRIINVRKFDENT